MDILRSPMLSLQSHLGTKPDNRGMRRNKKLKRRDPIVPNRGTLAAPENKKKIKTTMILTPEGDLTRRKRRSMAPNYLWIPI